VWVQKALCRSNSLEQEQESMLMILVNWLYTGTTVFLLGCGFSAFSVKIFHYKLKRTDSLLMAGLVLATVYAQFYSLLGSVSLIANLLLVGACLICLIACRKDILQILRGGEASYGPIKWIIVILLIGLWAFFTSRGYIHYDSDLYHGQSIRWIEEYGVVPGLGNLHERFAYNSSFFAVSALYSMRFLLGESLHSMSGFFALVLSISALDITKSWKRKKFLLSDYARAGAIYYLTTIIDEVVSPASDYSIMCVIFFIIIKWLDLLQEEEKEIAPYALLCVVGVYALTLKLTAGLVLLLLIKPAYLLIKEKRVREIILYICMGLVVAIPWFARTVVISGWLVYPLPALDLFSFDWEMSAELMEIDAAQISAWGKALYNVALLDTPASVWIPNWFRTTLSGTEKLLILGCVGCIGLYLIGLVWMFVKKQWKHLDMALVLLTVISSYLFWQMSAPLMRYGYAYVLLTDFLVLGWIVVRLGWNKLESIVYGMLLLYGVYKLYPMGVYCYAYRNEPYYMWQQDYGTYELESYEIQGVTFYKPVSGDRTGYDYFPAGPVKANIELRGEGLKDGFLPKQ